MEKIEVTKNAMITIVAVAIILCITVIGVIMTVHHTDMQTYYEDNDMVADLDKYGGKIYYNATASRYASTYYEVSKDAEVHIVGNSVQIIDASTTYYIPVSSIQYITINR